MSVMTRNMAAGETASAAPKVIDASGAEVVTIGGSSSLLAGDYARSGGDLAITGPDGTSVILVDYFAGASRPSLMTSDGGMLAGSTVESLAGPMFPGQYAQAGQSAASAGKSLGASIGKVQTLSGEATAKRSDGTTVKLTLDEPVYQGDVIETAKGATVSISFKDGSIFAVSSSARMVLDKMVYDDGGSSNSLLFNLIQGTFSFIAGKVAANGSMEVATPVATMGIRGTTVVANVEAGSGVSKFSLVADPDGKVGQVVVLSKVTGQQIGSITTTNTSLIVRDTTSAPVVVPRDVAGEQSAVDLIYNAFADKQRRGDIDLFDDERKLFQKASLDSSGITDSLNPADPLDTFATSRVGEIAPLGEPGQEGALLGDIGATLPETGFDTLTQQFGVSNDASAALITLELDDVPSEPLDTLPLDDFPAIDEPLVEPSPPAEPPIIPIASPEPPIAPEPTIPAVPETPPIVPDPIVPVAPPPPAPPEPPSPPPIPIDTAPVLSLPGVTPTVDEDGSVVVTGFDLATTSDTPLTVTITAASTVTLASTEGLTFTEGDGSDDETVVFTGSPDDILNALEGLTYIPTPDNDGDGGITIQIDNGTDVVSETLDVTIAPQPDAPVAVDDSFAATEGELLAGDLTSDNGAGPDSDPDTGDSIQVVAINGTAVAVGVPVTIDSGAVVTLQADGTFTYVPPDAAGTTAIYNDTFTYEIQDTTGLTSTATVSVDVTGLNDEPIVIAPTKADAVEDGAVVTVDLLGDVNDPDAGDTLSVGQVDGLEAGLTLNPDATVTVDPADASFQSLAQGAEKIVTLTYDVSDGNGGTVAQTAEIKVTGVNDDPVVVTQAGSGTYVENSAALVADSQLALSDVDSTVITGATVQITGNYQDGADVLSHAGTTNITANFDAATGTLSLSGTDTLANYQTVLQEVTYVNTSEAPSDAARTVEFTVTDDFSGTAADTKVIDVTPVNDAPTITGVSSNLVTNGSFEAGNPQGQFSEYSAAQPGNPIPGWNITGGSVDHINTLWEGSDGDRSIDLHGTSAGTIETTVDTVVGKDYLVTFDLAGNPVSGETAVDVRVTAGDESQDFSFNESTVPPSGASYTNMGWTEQSFTFTADTSQTDLTFASLDPTSAGGPAIDNVKVLPVGVVADEGSPTGISGLQVNDVDANGADEFTVQLNADHGTLTIDPSLAGLTITDNNSGAVTLTGSLDDINAALAATNGVTYTSEVNGADHDHITIVANDQGGNGIDPGLSGDATSEEGTGSLAIVVQPETVEYQVTLVEETAGFQSTFGWYNSNDPTQGEIVLPSIETGVTQPTNFEVDADIVGSLEYFLIPNGGVLNGSPTGEIQVVANGDGSHAIAPADSNQPYLGTNAGTQAAEPLAFFTDTSLNAGNVDYASSVTGAIPSMATDDRADGPTGIIAWEDQAAQPNGSGGYGPPGNQTYNDPTLDIQVVVDNGGNPQTSAAMAAPVASTTFAATSFTAAPVEVQQPDGSGPVPLSDPLDVDLTQVDNLPPEVGAPETNGDPTAAAQSAASEPAPDMPPSEPVPPVELHEPLGGEPLQLDGEIDLVDLSQVAALDSGPVDPQVSDPNALTLAPEDVFDTTATLEGDFVATLAPETEPPAIEPAQDNSETGQAIVEAPTEPAENESEGGAGDSATVSDILTNVAIDSDVATASPL
ncbi:MAG: choice-of-anchor C family protein [Hyphomicrobiaceae bacterium]